MSALFFFRGFNTYPDDNLRFGPLNYGRAHQHLEPIFTESGFRLYAFPDIGRGLQLHQLEQSYQYLLDISRIQKIHGNIHFLGHSAGGVIARGLAHHLDKYPIPNIKLKSVTTITSPHRGARIAKMISENKLNSQALQKILNTGIYKLKEKQSAFAPWTPEQLAIFNSTYVDLPHIHYASIISGTTVRQLPLPLQFVHKFLHEKNSITDGIIELSSQAWGQVLGQYELDHGAVLGVRTTFLPHIHKRNQQNFSDMTDKIIAHLRSVEYT
jgi:pimeloyl-ACP methyl ester carboxylesterase